MADDLLKNPKKKTVHYCKILKHQEAFQSDDCNNDIITAPLTMPRLVVVDGIGSIVLPLSQ
jgi:hypothetical protein